MRARFRLAADAAAILLIVVFLVACSVPAAMPDPRSADLVLHRGKVVTMDPARPQAEAVAVKGDRIIAVGSTAELRRYIGPSTETVDLEGRLLVPGFIEGHGHFLSLGEARMMLDLTTAASWEEIVARVARAAAEAAPGEWILGRGWHQEKWRSPPEPSVEGNPVHTALSVASPDNPVYLTHASGHASFANARAMALAGITAETADPAGGEIVRDGSGAATGLLRETAQGLVEQARERAEGRRSPAEAREALRRMVRLAGEEALSNGVTSFHDAGVSFSTIDFYRELADRGELPVRLYVMVGGESNERMAEALPAYRTLGHGGGFLTVRSIKKQLDGALGSHGAWLLAPYEDLPRSTGLNLLPLEELEQSARLALEHGYQLNTHAIGDRANRETLDVYARVFAAAGHPPDLRWRIEHAQHLHPDDVPRFRELGVIASMQGIHATSDGPWVPERIGAHRAEEGAYLWRTLHDAGVTVTNGTDVPVERIDPIANFHSTVSRRLPDGSVFFGEERLTREQALATYTINNAYAAFEEDVKGSITPGKLADLAVLSADLMTMPEEEILSTRVVLTILGGEIRYRAW